MMKIKQMGVLALLLCLGAIQALNAQTFDKLWQQVEQADKKSLPQTAIQLIDNIYQKGEKEKNSPQMLKAYMWRMKYKETLAPDSLYTSLAGLEQWVKQTDKPIDRAILHSLIAGIYSDYAVMNQWQLRQRTEIVDQTPPADIREWTANMYVEKIRIHAKEALADSVLLLKTSSRTYVPFVALGETSEYYHHDMYHLLALRSIEALHRVEGWNSSPFDDEDNSPDVVKQDIAVIYENMLSAYEASGSKEGYVLTMLYYLKWKYNGDRSGLEELRSKFKSDPVCAEVYFAQAQYAIRKKQQPEALLLCDEAIGLYPSYRRINVLKNLRQEILAPTLRVHAATQAYPGEEVRLNISHNNLDGFTIHLYNKAKQQILEQHYSLLRPNNYQVKDTSFTFKAPDVGAYTMRVVPDTRAVKDSENEFNVTRFKILTCSLPDDNVKAVALDIQTGHPIPNAQIILYDITNKVLQEFTTGEDGKVVFPRKLEYRYLKASKGNDTAMTKQRLHTGGYGDYEAVEDREDLMLLTDRSLYRPGQTVYVKGIAFAQKSDTANVLANKEYTVTLADANSQEVGRKTVRTNEFGSFAVDFALPSACLNGTYYLKCGKGSTTIRVEEYKRPTFDITFEKPQGSYKIGDEVQVKGKVQSYSGVLLQDLPVKYTVQRSLYVLWGMVGVRQIASGEVQVDENGEFTIPFLLKEESRYKENAKIFYRYSIEATVTNVAGETQSSVTIVSAGNRSLVLQTELKEKTYKDKPLDMVFQVHNLNRQPVEVKGTYFLYRAKDEDFKQREETPAAAGTFTSNEKTTLHWENLPSGAYVLKASVTDGQGKEVISESNTILFSDGDKRPPVETTEWFHTTNTEFDASHPATFSFGTSEEDTYVMMDVFCGNKLLESKALNLSDTIVHFTYPYQESYGNGILVTFCMVRNGQVYQEQARLEKRMPEKTLTMKWDVFRDKLRPGQQEEWKLTIKNPQGQAADAEMLAMMYDASLDKILNRQQDFQVFYNRIVPSISWKAGYFGENLFNFWWDRKSLNFPALEYDRFVTQLSMALAATRGMSAEGITIAEGPVAAKYVPPLTQTANDEAEFSAGWGQAGVIAPVDLRTNLAETAFFYPQLRTNEQGEISLSFTMPQSLTRWNFRGYAHTKGMLMGTLDGEATTSKEFMITPNLPRFVRVGDYTSIAASISNMTSEAQEGTVSLILFDPLTEKIISTQEQEFSVKAGKTVGTNFVFSATNQYDILGCRLIADSGTFSDGEQQLLPVLSNKEHLIETLPMPVRGEETRTFSLDSLFNRHSKTATNRKLTIEFTGNPAWYAIQALPSLSLPANNDAISWATAYYANSVASYIMNSQPRIKAIFDSWKLQGGTKETFLSNLQKNQEVKNILLSESPWVLEAQTEEQQKERIATLFDLNHISNNTTTALTKLQELQNADGAWSWYKGMSGNRYTTAYIAALNARLFYLTGRRPTGTALTLQKKAIAYLHQNALEEYKNILKAEKEGAKFTGVSGSILQYLYIIAICREQIPAANKDAYTYYLSKVGDLLQSTSMDTKATAAVVLDRAGSWTKAKEFVASLKEHLTKTDEQGMFFAFAENPYTWGSMKLQAHVNVMEALELIGGNSDTVEEMKLWLLKQKQTQQWNSPVATADAVYALLMKGTDLLATQGQANITIGNKVLSTTAPGAEAGLGYIKQVFTDKKTVDARSIRIEKQGQGIAWGAVYAAYESPISDVKQQDGGALDVQKQLYVERMVNNKPQLQPITAQTVLRIGDKVVSRLSIRADRPMDFVQLKDQRGACFEPIGSISGYRWSNGFSYYVDIKDASTNFFFDHLGKGVYVLEESYRVSRAGTYETGLATMQCAYAPEYASHAASTTVTAAE